MNSLIHTLNHLGGNFTGFALSMLVQSSLVIAVLYLLDLGLRRKVRAVVRYPLWMLLLVKLVLPPSLAAPTGLAYWLPERAIAKPSSVVTAPAVVRYSETGIVEPTVLQPLPPPRPRLQVAAKLLLAWLVIALGLIALLVRRSHSVARTAARAVPASKSPEELLEACRQQMGIGGRIGVKLSANTGSPAVCGLWRPVILIPRALSDKLAPTQLRAVLFHELAHIQRGDIWMNYIQTLLQIFYWWHPLLWLANARIRRVREQAVDERVMVELGGDAEAYPTTLIEVAKLASRHSTPALGLIGIVESKSALAQRIRHLLDCPSPKSAKLGFARLTAVALLGAVLLPMARGQRTLDHRPRVESEAANQPALVALGVSFIEIEETGLAALELAEPTKTEVNGDRAWVLTPEELNRVLQRALVQTGADVLAADRVTAFSGQQSQFQVGTVVPVEGTQMRVGPTCDLTPCVFGELIDLAVVASVTERKAVDPAAPFTTAADAFQTNAAGAARVIVGDGGGVVLENPDARSSKGNRYLVIVSANIVSDRAAKSRPRYESSAAATDAASQKQDAPTATLLDAPRTLPSNPPNNQPTNRVTGSKQQAATKRFELPSGEGVEIATIKSTEIQCDYEETGICIVTNNFVARFRGAELSARRVKINTKTGDVTAEGDVIFKLGNHTWYCEYLQYNFIERRITHVNTDSGFVTGITPSPSSSQVAPSNLVPVLGDLPLVGRQFRSEAKPESPGRKATQAKFNPEAVMDSGDDFLFQPADETDAASNRDERAKTRQPGGRSAALETRVFKFDPQTFFEDAHRFLLDAGLSDIEIFGRSNDWKLSITRKFCESLGVSQEPPNTFFYSEGKGSLMVRATAEELDRVQKSIENLNALKQSASQSPAANAKVAEDKVRFETRVFNITPSTLLEGLKNTSGVPANSGTIGSIQDWIRKFFAAAGVNVQPPNALFYNDRIGVLMVRATAKEMDIVEKALKTLDYRPSQITIEARFIEMPTETAGDLGLDLPSSSRTSKTWTRVLTAAQARAVLHAAKQRAGVDILSAPKITTLSGRQAQIQVSDVDNVVKGLRAEPLTPPGLQSTNRVAAEADLASAVRPGLTLDVLAHVRPDGYTIQLSAQSQTAELLRYDNTPDGVLKTRLKAGDKNRAVGVPLMRIQSQILRTRRMEAAIDVYDGQTLVLANPKVTFTSVQGIGELVTDAVPEDAGKRLLVFITPTMIDPAGNPIHMLGKEPFPADKPPPQPAR